MMHDHGIFFKGNGRFSLNQLLQQIRIASKYSIELQEAPKAFHPSPDDCRVIRSISAKEWPIISPEHQSKIHGFRWDCYRLAKNECRWLSQSLIKNDIDGAAADDDCIEPIRTSSSGWKLVGWLMNEKCHLWSPPAPSPHRARWGMKRKNYVIYSISFKKVAAVSMRFWASHVFHNANWSAIP